GVRRLQEDPGAVAGVLLGARRAPVLQIEEHFQSLGHDLVRGATLDVGDEPEAAGIVLESWVVQPLPGRIACFWHPHALLPDGRLTAVRTATLTAPGTRMQAFLPRRDETDETVGLTGARRGAPAAKRPEPWRAAPSIRALSSWSGTPGSNRRPSPWQGDALPAELVPRSAALIK